MVSNETAHELHTERQLEALSKVGLDAKYTFVGGVSQIKPPYKYPTSFD